jgi:hypothetical protein
LHHRDDDDYLHFLEKEKYFTPKKWLKSWRPVFCCCQFLLLSISQLLYLNIGEREREREKKKLVATVLYIQRWKKWGIFGGGGGGRWRGTFLTPGHRAHRISDSR